MTPNTPSLVRRAVAGDRIALGELARGAFPKLVAICQARVGQRADAEELAQETLLRALRNLDRLESEQYFEAWLRGIADHLCIDWHRSRIRRSSSDPPGDRVSVDPSQIVAARDEGEQLRQRIHELPMELKEVLYLHYYDEMTYDEMARWLGVARATVNERLAKARSQLKHKLLAHGGNRHG
jgi:RNA polymerase sigma factor (sigma-70 family)